MKPRVPLLSTLLRADTLAVTHLHPQRYLRVNQAHPIHTAIFDVLRYAYGPLAILPDELSQIAGIDEAHLYGCLAARYEARS